jgi:hypothetical protein
MGVDNTLAPHGGPFVERVLDPAEGAKTIKGLTEVPAWPTGSSPPSPGS